MATPSAASAGGPVGYQYLTTYSGTYDFTDSFRAQPNAPDGLETRAHYEWLTYDYETIVIAPDRPSAKAWLAALRKRLVNIWP